MFLPQSLFIKWFILIIFEIEERNGDRKWAFIHWLTGIQAVSPARVAVIDIWAIIVYLSERGLEKAGTLCQNSDSCSNAGCVHPKWWLRHSGPGANINYLWPESQLWSSVNTALLIVDYESKCYVHLIFLIFMQRQLLFIFNHSLCSL